MSTAPPAEIKAKRAPISPMVAVSAIGAVVLVLLVAAYLVFGPKPKPEVKYSPYALMMKAKRNPGSLTADEQEALQRVTAAPSPAASQAGAQAGNFMAGGKYVPPSLAAHRPH